MHALSLALLISVGRYFYLQFAHDRIYTATHGYINGYVLISILLYFLQIPWYVILGALSLRLLYRNFIGRKVIHTSNHPFNVFAFFVLLSTVLSVRG